MARLTKIDKKLLETRKQYMLFTGKSLEEVNNEIAMLELEGWPKEGLIGILNFRIYLYRKGKSLNDNQ